MPKSIIPVISLFSGAGGMDLGFRKHGFLPILALDIDQVAVDTYNWNDRRSIAQQVDLSKLSDSEIVRMVREAAGNLKPRGVIGGPPCQSFSVSNVHRKARDPRHQLPIRYANILKALNDEFGLDFFVFENVTGLKSSKHKHHFKKILKAFDEAGFNVFEQELVSSNYGVPQNRHRLFLVGINKQKYPLLKFQYPSGQPDAPKTVRDVLADLPKPVYFQKSLKLKDIPYHPNHWTMRPRSAKFKKGLRSNGRSFRKLRWDKPSWTVAYGHRELHIHPNGRRRVSIFEAMLLQGFPKSYRLRGNLTQQVTQVSNAVPPPVASAVAKSIKSTLYDRVEKIQRALLDWFKKNKRAFPWRDTTDPFKILIAEKLLQQTAATSTVVVAYNELATVYPTSRALASADKKAIEQIVKPLGLTYRAGELLSLAHTIYNNKHETVPNSLRELLDLPGIGDYIARAVLSFAYNQDVPIVDTNVARLLFRVFGVEEPLPSNPARSRRLIAMTESLIPKGKAREFNWGMLDLCARHCVSIKPDCQYCPIRPSCEYGSRSKPRSSNGHVAY
jgi:DNA (cytosine-5)-methyltransferase 1